MRWKHWVIFGAVQCAGFTLPSFANIHSNPGPLFLGLLFLFPGCLILIVLPHWMDNLPQWAGYLVAGVPVVCVNALVWYWAVRVLRAKGS